MQRWESISRRYRDLNPEPSSSLTPAKVARLRIWLEDDVLPFLAETTHLPRFRELATFSLRTLMPGSASSERRAVECVDQALTDWGRLLVRVANDPSLRARLEGASTRSIVHGGTINILAGPNRTLSERVTIDSSLTENGNDLSLLISAVEREAREERDDLVNPDDYFSIQQRFVEESDGTRIQCGEMISSLNPRLLPIGDLISRGLRRRIDIRLGAMNELQRRVNQVLTDHQLTNTEEVMFCQQAAREVEGAVTRLAAMLFSDAEATLRESCVALTQVYASLHPAPQLAWLGIRDELLIAARSGFPALLQGPRGSTIHDRIARAVEDMSTLWRGLDPSVSHLQRAIASGVLVISEADQTVWWEGRQLDLGKGRTQKEFLIALARNALRNRPVAEADLYPNDAQSESTMANRWTRLGPLLPPSLSQHIRHGDSPRTYRLHLERHQIFLI